MSFVARIISDGKEIGIKVNAGNVLFVIQGKSKQVVRNARNVIQIVGECKFRECSIRDAFKRRYSTRCRSGWESRVFIQGLEGHAVLSDWGKEYLDRRRNGERSELLT